MKQLCKKMNDMENRSQTRKWNVPDTITGWVLLFFGLFALSGGIIGIVGVMAFSLTSVSAVNNGILHFIGVFKRWAFFPYYAIISRTLMGVGLLYMYLGGMGDDSFVGGIIFEFAGVLILIISLLSDTRRKKINEKRR